MKDSTGARVAVTLAALVALVGLGASAVLLQHHLAMATGKNPMLSAVCGMTESASCDEVLASEWASFRGIPTAMLGLFYFALMASWMIVVGRPRGTRRPLQVLPLIAAAVGAGVAGGFAYVMYARLPKWCPLCAVTHVAAWLLFILVLLLWQRAGRGGHAAHADDASGAFPVVPEDGASVPAPPLVPAHPSLRLLLVTLLLAGTSSAFAWSEYHRRLEAQNAREYFARWQDYESDHVEVYRKFLTQPVVEIPVNVMTDSIRGDLSAPHTVVMFSDFQCTFCPRLDAMLKQKLEKFPDRFKIVYKHFPMNRDCNRHVTGKTHVAACAAAVTAEAARKIGGDEMFWRMHDELFARQGQFAARNREFMAQAAERLGLDVDAIWNEIRTSSIWQRISQHVEEGHTIGVKGTPEVFFDGRRVQGWVNSKFWDYLLNMDRPKARSAPTTTPAASGE